MKVHELMVKEVEATSADATIAEAIGILADAHIHGLPVVKGAGRQLVGVISASDILQALTEQEDADGRERLLQETVVREVMTPNPETITPTADAKDAAERMLYLEVHRLFVVEEGQLVGVVSQSDIVRAVALQRL